MTLQPIKAIFPLALKVSTLICQSAEILKKTTPHYLIVKLKQRFYKLFLIVKRSCTLIFAHLLCIGQCGSIA